VSKKKKIVLRQSQKGKERPRSWQQKTSYLDPSPRSGVKKKKRKKEISKHDKGKKRKAQISSQRGLGVSSLKIGRTLNTKSVSIREKRGDAKPPPAGKGTLFDDKTNNRLGSAVGGKRKKKKGKKRAFFPGQGGEGKIPHHAERVINHSRPN